MRKCEVCAGPLSAKRPHVKCCSMSCRSERLARKRKAAETPCRHCGTPFYTTHKKQIYCSHRCHARHACLGGSGNYETLRRYYAAGGTNGCRSPVGKGLECCHCGRRFDAHPHKVREGKGKFCSNACRLASIRNPDVPDNRRQRCSPEYRAWQKAVFERDGFRCRRCSEGGLIHAHHVLPFATYPALRFDVGNGETLCYNCHQLQHGRPTRVFLCRDCGGPRTPKSRSRCFRCHQRYASHCRWRKS
jgi:hypothetical protein